MKEKIRRFPRETFRDHSSFSRWRAISARHAECERLGSEAHVLRGDVASQEVVDAVAHARHLRDHAVRARLAVPEQWYCWQLVERSQMGAKYWLFRMLTFAHIFSWKNYNTSILKCRFLNWKFRRRSWDRLHFTSFYINTHVGAIEPDGSLDSIRRAHDCIHCHILEICTVM